MLLLVTLARLVLAGVFVVSAIAKLRDRAGSREAVEAFKVPAPLVGAVTVSLPYVELLCALLLLLADPFALLGGVASALLLVAFTVAVLANLLRGRRPACHCFGSLGDGSAIGWHTVGRNAALLVLAAVAMVDAGSRSSVPGELGDLTGLEGLVLGAFVVLTAMVVGLALALQTLMGRYGDVLVRLETLEQATGLAEPPAAPAFALSDLDGVTSSLDDLVADGRPTLMAFVSPSCSNCAAVLPDLLEWQSDPRQPVSVTVVSDGPEDANRAKLADVGPLRVLLDHAGLLYEFGAEGTPAAVLVDEGGRIASPVVHGAESIRTLHTNLLANLGGRVLDDHAGHGHGHDPALHEIGPRPVAEGDPMPEVRLADEEGAEVDALDLVGEDAVLLFWRTDCGFCQQILEDVRELEKQTPVRIVSGSDLEALRGSGLTSPVVRDPQLFLEGWLGVPGTPSAARVRHGELASDVGVGGPDVLSVLRSARQSDQLA